MLQKFLLIGVGGSGGKTLRYVWRELDRQLRRTNWDGEMPLGWQFLHIDVRELQDAVEGDVPADVTNFTYVGLAKASAPYQHYDNKLVEREEVLTAVAGWRPDPTRSYSAPWNGAGQRRVVGRVVTIEKADEIRLAVQDAVNKLTDTEADLQLRELGRLLGADAGQQNVAGASSIVVSSMGGGSGSGAFLDVIEILRTNATQGAQWTDTELMTVLYTADVFSELKSGGMGAGIEPNTLAAFSEFLSASEHEGPVSAAEQALIETGAGTNWSYGRRTGSYTFFVGARNKFLALDSSHEVYRSVGKALATYMIDDNIQHQVSSYIGTNSDGRPCSPEFPFARDGRSASLGFASVALGRSLFAEYATERLARRALTRLVEGYKESVTDPSKRMEVLVEEKVSGLVEPFFAASGLYEFSDEHNQVLDRLRDAGEFKSRIEALIGSVHDGLITFTKAALGKIRGEIDADMTEPLAEFEKWAAADRRARAGSLIDDVQRNLRNLTAEYIGNHGLHVTIGLLEKLDEQVLAAAEQMRVDHERLRDAVGSAMNHLQSIFNDLKREVGHNSPEVNEIFGTHSSLLKRTHERTALIAAEHFVKRASYGLVRPMIQRLQSTLEQLSQTVDSPDWATVIRQWSTGPVPRHLLAADNELLLESQAEAPDRLGQLFGQMSGSDSPGVGESNAIAEIIARAWPTRDTLQPSQGLIHPDMTWVPTDLTIAAEGAGAGNLATFKVELTPASIESDAREWVYTRSGQVASYINETLAEWLDPNRPGAAKNAQTFADNFVTAVSKSAPLISVNDTVHNAVHGSDPTPPITIVSEIPLDINHSAAKQCLQALAEARVPEAVAQSLFNSNSDAVTVEFMSFTGSYVHPIVFDSLTGPIANQWHQCGSQPERDRFWDFRRARTLSAFVPLSEARQRALVRGWMVADVLGYVPRITGSWSESPLTIWSPEGTRRFPAHLLGHDVTKQGEVLAALLETLPLAMVTYTGKPDDELASYIRLLKLGGSIAGVEDANRANPELERWVLLGERTPAEEGCAEAPTPKVGSASETAEERQAEIVAGFETFESIYRERIATKPVTPATTLTLGRSWEAHGVIASAARQLIASTRQIGLDYNDPSEYAGPDTP